MHDITLSFEEARMHGIAGPAGSGKTLLLHLLGLLDEPDFGTVEIFGETVSPAPDEIRREIRNSAFGYIFPNPCLLPAFTVAENIAMPLFRISGADEHSAHDRVSELVHLFGIERLANEPAATLDFDTQFLATLARALVHRPRILLLLVPGRPTALAAHVRAVVDQLHITCIWGGAENDLLPFCDRTVTLQRGYISAESAAVS